MKRVIYKITSVATALILILSFVVGCQGKKDDSSTPAARETSAVSGAGQSKQEENENQEKEFVTLKALMPGDESKRMREFLAGEFKQKMKEELNLEIQVDYSPWDQIWAKLDMMISAGERLDWFWNASVHVPKMMAQKSFAPLNDAVEKYGQDLKKVIPEENFKAFTINGELICIPTAYAPTAELFNTILVRQDILESVGMNEIKTIEDIELFYEKAKEKFPQMKFQSTSFNYNLDRVFSDSLKCFDGWMVIDTKTNKVECRYLTEAYKKTALKNYEWGKKGFYAEEVSLKPNEALGRMATGEYLLCSGAISRPLEDISSVRKNVPSARYKEYILAPEKGKAKFIACFNFLVAGPKSKYVDRFVEFVNWVYKSKDNYNFILYGVKGKDYEIENGRLKMINTDTLFYEWMFRNVSIMDFPDYVDDDFIETFKNWDNGAVVPDFYGFVFDGTKLAAEYAKISTVIAEKFQPFETGIVDFEAKYPEAVNALKDAGIDKYVEEYQRQLDAYIASRK